MSDWAKGRYEEFYSLMIQKYRSADGKVFCQLRSCGEEIDLSLPRNSPAGCTIDHIMPQELYPELVLDSSNHQPLHNRCNMIKGTKSQSSLDSKWVSENSVDRIY